MTTAATSRMQQRLKTLAGGMGDQWERERRDALFLMGATLLAALPQAPQVPWWASAGFALLFGWRLALILAGRELPRAPLRWAASLACAGAVFAQYGTLLGREPGVTMLLLLLGLKLMEMAVRRDLFVVIFLCFFLLLTSFFHSQSMLAGAMTLVAVLALVTAMLTMQFGAREQAVSRRLRTASGILLQAAPIAILCFLLFPRIQGPLWGMPGDAYSGRTGLSDSMSPGLISTLVQSDEIAFRVAFDGAPPAPAQMYWRGPVFGDFDGRTWTPLSGRRAPMPAPQVQGAPDTLLRYTVTQEPSNRPWLFALDRLAEVEPSAGAAPTLMPDLQLLARRPVTQRIRYRLASLPEARLGLNETAASLRNWTRLPGDSSPRTRALAAQWVTQAPEGPERAQALVTRALQHLAAAPFRYTLTPPRLSGDPVDGFLFDARAGFCEHYAGAFVVLMRAMDIPARVVTGYQGGERNPVDGYWTIRQANAHAWAEAWLPGRGWTRIDPTAVIPPDRVDEGSRTLQTAETRAMFELSLLDRARFNLDALGNAWSQWVLSYGQSRQRRLLQDFGADVDWRGMVGLLAVGVMAAVAAVAALTLRPRGRRDPVARSYAEFCARLASAGVSRAPHETAHALLRRARGALSPEALRRAETIVRLYNHLQYDEATPERGARVRHLRTLVRSFKP